MNSLRFRLIPMVAVTALSVPAFGQWQGFEPVLSIDSGLIAAFQMDFSETEHYHAGGAAAGDIDGDGFADLVILRGNNSPRLFINDGDGSFSDSTSAAGLSDFVGDDGDTDIINGVLLGDVDSDGDLDLLLGGLNVSNAPPPPPPGIPAPTTPTRLFLNDGSGHFTNHTGASGIVAPIDQDGVQIGVSSMALGDVDRDGRVDLMIAYWHQGGGSSEGHLWRNLGNGQFVDVSLAAGLGSQYAGNDTLFNFTPSFTDLDDDGWPDLVVAADFGNSRVWLNQHDGSFANAPDQSAISDENGMGGTVADFDNDGDFDWFVTSIWEDTGESRPYGVTGNRLYENDGTGTLTDVTDVAGVRAGDWGWGSCAADFDNDGWIDLLMVNGYQTHQLRFTGNPARLFMNNGDGTFTEQAAEFGLDHTGQGRAVACFDRDNDGLIDVLVQNSHAASGETAVQPQLFANLGGSGHHWLTVRLSGTALNRHAIGAKITLTTAGGTQVREVRAGNSFLSSQWRPAHFGLGPHDQVQMLEIRWPNGRVTSHADMAADQILDINYDALFNDRFD